MEKYVKQFADELAATLGGKAENYQGTYFVFKKGFLKKEIAARIISKDGKTFIFVTADLTEPAKKLIDSSKKSLNLTIY